jgi:seryl-tRNA synthetase
MKSCAIPKTPKTKSTQYKVVEDSKDTATDKYLIATSEQPLSALV